MRRRDFLKTSAALSGAVLVADSCLSAGAPCAPPTLAIEGGVGGEASCEQLSVPYDLPSSGAAVAISSNTAAQIKPAGIDGRNWAYSLFNSYGSGAFNPDFSVAGAFVIAGTGGHGAPPNVDAAIFDFSTGAWRLLPNANGIPARNADYAPSEVNLTYAEIIAAGTGNAPTPAHLYGLAGHLPRSMGGGSKGSYVTMGRIASTTASHGVGSLHRMDLATGLWTRLTSDKVEVLSFESTAVFDPVERRYYIIPDAFHSRNSLQYFDVATSTVRRTSSYPYPADYTSSGYQTTWLDPVRRLILNQRPGWSLRALDLANISGGWVVLNTSGSQPGAANRWAYYEPDGRFYTRGNNSGQVLNRLTPPANWRTGTWSYDTVSVDGATLPNFTNVASNGTRHYGTFFYVPALRSLAWISGEATPVVLLRPPL